MLRNNFSGSQFWFSKRFSIFALQSPHFSDAHTQSDKFHNQQICQDIQSTTFRNWSRRRRWNNTNIIKYIPIYSNMSHALTSFQLSLHYSRIWFLVAQFQSTIPARQQPEAPDSSNTILYNTAAKPRSKRDWSTFHETIFATTITGPAKWLNLRNDVVRCCSMLQGKKDVSRWNK